MIELSSLNRQECVRYLGNAKVQMNSQMEKLLDICEREVIETANTKYLYKEVPVNNPELSEGNDIKNHLQGCYSAIIMCATLGNSIDTLIRKTQLSDMAKAVVLDSFASVAIEQVCCSVDEIIAEKFSGKYLTFRFSPGYGDYPITLQKQFLNILDAQRKIGLCTNDNYLLTPTKSVTAVMGISYNEIEQRKRGCAVCSLKGNCRYRKAGSHCGF